MTVSTTASTTQAFPNGVTTVFPINYRFFTKADLKVFWLKPDGTVHLLVLDSEYTVQGAGNEDGGSITTIGTPLNGGTLTIARIMTATQLTSFRNQGEFFAEIHEDAFDKLVMLVQQAIDNQGRGLTVPVSDPVGLDLEMPGAAVRATKMLGFDSAGSPVQSTMTMQQIEQQPALAVASAQAAAAAAGTATEAADSASESAQAAADSAASVDGRAGRFFGELVMLPNRQSSPNGVIKADGQWITNATALYPAVVADLQSATPSVPVVTPAVWLADPLSRASWAWDAANNRIRVPDWNGVQAGSIGPLMFRGDGTLGFAPGKARMDQMQGHKHRTVPGTTPGSTSYDPEFVLDGVATPGGGAFASSGSWAKFASGVPVPDGVNGTPRTGSETFGKHGVGVWGVVLFGSVSNPGAADAAALATSYANQQAAITLINSQLGYSIVYPGGGDANTPGNVAVNTRYAVANPFGNVPVICLAQLLINGEWETAEPATSGSTAATYGVHAAGRASEIVARTGSFSLHSNGPTVQLSTIPAYPGAQVTSAPCRVLVWRVKG